MTGALISREVRRGLHGGAWMPVIFFLLVATIVPFAVGPDARLLARIGGGALWIAALTAAMLPIERLIEPDRADGSIRGDGRQLLPHLDRKTPRRSQNAAFLPSCRSRSPDSPWWLGHPLVAARGLPPDPGGARSGQVGR